MTIWDVGLLSEAALQWTGSCSTLNNLHHWVEDNCQSLHNQSINISTEMSWPFFIKLVWADISRCAWVFSPCFRCHYKYKSQSKLISNRERDNKPCITFNQIVQIWGKFTRKENDTHITIVCMLCRFFKVCYLCIMRYRLTSQDHGRLFKVNATNCNQGHVATYSWGWKNPFTVRKDGRHGYHSIGACGWLCSHCIQL